MTADRRGVRRRPPDAIAAAAPAAAATKDAGASFLPGASSRQPVSIDADKLVYFDKEQKAVYSGNVVVIQGDTKMTCSAMTVYHRAVAGASDQADAGTGRRRRPSAARAVAELGHQASRRRRDRSPSSPRPRSPPATAAPTTRRRTRCC